MTECTCGGNHAKSEDEVIVATGPQGSVVDEIIDILDADGKLVIEDETMTVYDADANVISREEEIRIPLAD